MENDFLTEEFVADEQNYVEVDNITNDDAYSENGFKKYINKYKNSPFFWPVIIFLLILLIGIIIFSIVINSTGKLKTAELTAPSVIYLGENETISAKGIGSGNLRRTSFHYDISNSSIVELTSKAGKTGKKTTNELIPISTGKFLLYVEAELEGKKIERIEKEILICKSFSKEAFQKEKITLIKGKKYNIHLDLGTEKECYQDIEYKIDDEDIATIDETGKIISTNTGETKITIIKGKKKITTTIKVIDPAKEIKVSGIKVDKENVTIEIGSTTKIIATILPENATNKSLKWKSSNNSVVTISNKGVIKGIGKGNAKITIETVDGNYKKEVIVTVKEGNKASIIKPSTNKEIKVKEIKLNKSKTTLLVGGKEQLTATISPANAANKTIKWTTSNKNVVEVSQKGIITGKKEGTAKIEVLSGGKKDSITVTVTKKTVAVTKVSVTPSSKTINVGESITLTAKVSPTNATNQNIIWKSSDNSVATVSKGVVKGLKAGSVTITAESNNGKKDTAIIKITNPSKPSTPSTPKKDTSKPVLTKASLSSNNISTSKAIKGNTITLKMEFNENLSNKPSVEIADKVVSVTGSGKKYTATYKVTDQTPIGKVSIKIYNYKDMSNNTGDVVTATTDQSRVTVSLPTFIVAYNNNGGTGAISNQEIVYGQSTKLTKNDNKITKSGYEFIGWKAKNSSGKIRGCTNDSTCNSDNTTLGWYADSKIKTYYLYLDNGTVSKTEEPGKTVTMIAQWIKVEKTKSTNTNSTTTQLSYKVTVPSKVKLKLYASTKSSTLGSSKITYTSTSTQSFNATRKNTDYKLYIKVCLDQTNKVCSKQQNVTIPANAFKVKFNSSNGKGTMADQYIVHGQSTKLRKNTFTKSGYNFLGWVAKKSDDKRNGCETGTICNSSNSEWRDISKIYSYYIYKDEQSISKTVAAGQTVEMVALWGKLKTAEAIDCSSTSCNIKWEIDSSTRVGWDLYYNNTKSATSKNVMGSASGKMTNFTRGTSDKTITVKACLTSNSSICTNTKNVTIKAKSTSTSNSTTKPSQQETTGMSICCLIISNKKIVYNKTVYSKYTWDKISNYGIYDYSKVCVRTNGTISALGGGYITTKSACEALNK